MVHLCPVLSRRLVVRSHITRIIDPKTNSFYHVIAADAAGALGSGPSGVAADEILAWRDRSMWDALRSGMGSGARRQPLMVAATTAGSDPSGFAAAMHAEMVRVDDDGSRAARVRVPAQHPRRRRPFDEANWSFANPALDDFLSREAMRAEALEARNNPSAENSFLQFRLNRWVRQASRWMPMHLYEASSGEVWPTPDWERERLAGRLAWCGFDLAAKLDLTAWCLIFPPTTPEGAVDVLWRFWRPDRLARHLGDDRFDQWPAQGWINVTTGEALDDDQVYAYIEQDHRTFRIRGGDCDQWSMYPVIHEISKRLGVQIERDLVPYGARMSG